MFATGRTALPRQGSLGRACHTFALRTTQAEQVILLPDERGKVRDFERAYFQCHVSPSAILAGRGFFISSTKYGTITALACLSIVAVLRLRARSRFTRAHYRSLPVQSGNSLP